MVGLSLRMGSYAYGYLINQNITKEATEAKKNHCDQHKNVSI